MSFRRGPVWGTVFFLMLFFTGRLGRPHLETLAFGVVFSSAKAFYFALEGTPQPFSPCALVWFAFGSSKS